jgi:rfaE bifunctional protein nucleotidyltransferase chain/domain
MTIAEKIQSEDELRRLMPSLPRPIVFTNGVFDVLHRGHVAYLEQAAELGATLIVALNTDRSVRALEKGPDRPLNKEQDRAFVLAGLQSVGFVTLFDDETPVRLVQSLKPDLYVKGGDYDMSMLPEAQAVSQYGGEAIALRFDVGFSTTSFIERVRSKPRKCVFLDRDGVINVDSGYIGNPADFQLIDGVPEALNSLISSGFAVVIVTNQSGIARGYFSEEQYEAVNAYMLKELATRGVHIDGVFHCPHHPDSLIPQYARVCGCRKPAPGLIMRAQRELGLSVADSILIGDKDSDIQAGHKAGVGLSYLVGSKAKTDEGKKTTLPDECFENLKEAVEFILSNVRGQ